MKGLHCLSPCSAPCRCRAARPVLLLSALGILVGRPPATISARAAQIFALSAPGRSRPQCPCPRPTTPIGGLAAKIVATALVSRSPRYPPKSRATGYCSTSKSDFDPRSPLGRRTDGSAPGLEGAFEQLTGGAVPASASPIQRAVTSAFKVVQTIRCAAQSRRGRAGRDAGRPVQVAVAVGVRLDLGGATVEDRF